jgi:peroxiredoxin
MPEVQAGDVIPEVTMKELVTGAEGPVEIQLTDLIKGKKVAIFGVPGGRFHHTRRHATENILLFHYYHFPRIDAPLTPAACPLIPAFTPGCSKSHLPSYITAQDDLKAKGVDMTICVATNDAYVMEVSGDSGVCLLIGSD